MRATSTLSRLLVLTAIGCTGTSTGCDGDPGGSPTILPTRDAWEVAARVPFDHEGEDGAINIGNVQIGGRLTGGSNRNFANRGDVIVLFDGPEDTITVELRKFTAALNETAAQDDYDALSLWAFNSNQSSPLPPEDMDS